MVGVCNFDNIFFSLDSHPARIISQNIIRTFSGSVHSLEYLVVDRSIATFQLNLK